MIETAEGKSHFVIKRDGRLEPYNPSKLYQVLLWACNDSEILANSILESMDLKIYNKIHISTLLDEVIDTAMNLTSRLTPQYAEVAQRLYLQKMYKELYSMRRGEYPSYNLVLENLINNGNIINIFKILSEEEIAKLNKAIKPERDFRLPFAGLLTYFSKSSLKIDNKPVELPQHGFMRLAIQAFLYEDPLERTDLIIKRYNDLSFGEYTEATPKWLNSLTKNPQMASCCLHQMDDSIESINETIANIGQYSKYGGGNAVDISSLRSRNSTIGTNGKSSGPIPFIKHIESSINAYNQLGARPGACVVTFPWWHFNVMEMLELKDEGGVESARARNLQYSIKINRLFLERIQSGEDITLFDPKEAKELLTLHGESFNKAYIEFEQKGLGKKISAREVAYKLAQIRAETGNLYIFFDENANEKTPFKEKITQSNLCTEIFLPTKAAKPIANNLFYDYSTNKHKTSFEYEAGSLALCNLSSINVAAFMNKDYDERYEIAYNLLRASDNLIDYQYYPIKDGEHFNKNYRAIGIGMNNLAYHFARKNIKYSSPEALAEMEHISYEMKYVFHKANEQLAKERGNFPYYSRTNWNKPSRFATLFAIAPTASSSLIIGATEGIEPVVNLINEKTGTYSTKQLVPEIRTFGSNYELAFDVPTKSLYDLAAIRQRILLDQGQSINTYEKNTDSAYKIISDIIYAESIGLKSLYYLQSKNSEVEVCESCSS